MRLHELTPVNDFSITFGINESLIVNSFSTGRLIGVEAPKQKYVNGVPLFPREEIESWLDRLHSHDSEGM